MPGTVEVAYRRLRRAMVIRQQKGEHERQHVRITAHAIVECHMSVRVTEWLLIDV